MERPDRDPTAATQGLPCASGGTTITLLAPHLTDDNHRAVLDEARYRSRRDAERIVARLRPLPDVATSVRKLPQRPVRQPAAVATAVAQSSTVAPDTAQSTPTPVAHVLPDRPAPAVAAAYQVGASVRPLVKPVSAVRYSLKLTIGQEAHDMLERAQALLRHAVPDGDLAVVFERALRALLRELERTRLAAAIRPRTASPSPGGGRRIRAAVRRAVWKRDEGRCAFVGADGRRCDETAFLELHHVVPVADGGQATVENLSLRCRAHNQYEADLWFGPMRVREAGETANTAHQRMAGTDRVRVGEGTGVAASANANPARRSYNVRPDRLDLGE